MAHSNGENVRNTAHMGKAVCHNPVRFIQYTGDNADEVIKYIDAEVLWQSEEYMIIDCEETENSRKGTVFLPKGGYLIIETDTIFRPEPKECFEKFYHVVED